jgi:hypothetical protein
MWFLTVQAIPKPNTLTTEDFGGAAVMCWINFPALDGAEQLANFYLDQEGWMITNIEHTAWVELNEYRKHDVGWGYACEAQNSGASFLIQAYMPDNLPQTEKLN